MTQYLSMSEREGPCDGSHGRFCPECAAFNRWHDRDAAKPVIVDEESATFEVVDALTLDQWVATFPEEQREAVLTYAEMAWREQEVFDGEVPTGIRLNRAEMLGLRWVHQVDGDE